MENCEKHEAAQACACGCAEGQVPIEAEKIESRRSYIPAVNILDSEAQTKLLVDVPGAEESGLDLTIEKNILTIKAKVDAPQFEGSKLIYAEYRIGDYQRSFILSDNVDKDGISASLKDGVLTVTLPKVQPVTKKIAISSN